MDKTVKEIEFKNDNTVEEEKCPKCGEALENCKCQNYVLEEIPEYIKLKNAYSALEASYNELKNEKNILEEESKVLKDFKASVDKKEKEEMINSFCMLSDEDKEDVISNIDTYSLEDIEAKLSIICVRKKVNFGSEQGVKDPTTYNLADMQDEDSLIPAWVKAIENTIKSY